MDGHVSVTEFNAALWKRFKEGKIRNVYPVTKYNDIVEKIKSIEENPPCNIPGEYYLLRKFIVVNVDGKERLSCKPENFSYEKTEDSCNTKMKFYVALEEIYGYIEEAHKLVKHGGRDRIVRNIQNQGIVNIARDTVELFLSFCKVCRVKYAYARRKDGSRRGSAKAPLNAVNHSLNSDRLCDSPVNNISSESENAERLPINNICGTETVKIELNENSSCNAVCSFTRGYVDLIDLSSTPDGEYRFVFVYLDLQTCFCVLHPVRCKCIYEVVSHLLNIFTLIGPPQVLHGSFDNQFLNTVIQDIKRTWPEVVIVSGASNYHELQEVAQNSVSEINCMLKSWMLDNNTKHWSSGLKFTQLRKNTKLVGNNTKSPYECFFGRPMDTSKLPPLVDVNLLRQAQKEEDLLSIVNQQTQSQSYEHLQVTLDPNICNLVQANVPVTESNPEQVIRNTIIKVEPLSDNERTEGLSDSSTELCASPNFGNLEIVIKQEADD